LLNPYIKYDYTINSIVTKLDNLSDKSSVYYSNGLIYNPEQQSVVVFNASGMKVSYSKDKTISAESLSKGVYVVQTDNKKVFKFIK